MIIQIAEISPKLSGMSNIYNLTFQPGSTVDVQTKAAILGMALYFTMELAYPELTNIYEESKSRTEK